VHVFLPDTQRRQPVAFLNLLHAAQRFLVKLRVLNGDGDLVGHRLQHGDQGIVEGVALPALQVERADDRVADTERDRQLGAGFRQELVAAVYLAGGCVARRDRAALLRHLPDDADAADGQPVPAGEQELARLAGAGAQHGVAAVGVDQKDLRVIDEVESFDDQIDDAGDEG